jgi:hypothetical protein
MTEKKTLLPELLPTPLRHAQAGASGARARVLKHLTTVVTAGATAFALQGCPSCIAVDPLPQPARCAPPTSDPRLLVGTKAAQVYAWGTQREVRITLQFDYGVTKLIVTGATGGVLVENPTFDGSTSVARLTPSSGATSLSVRYLMDCSSGEQGPFEAVVTLTGDAFPSDGGVADGGTADGGMLPDGGPLWQPASTLTVTLEPAP